MTANASQAIRPFRVFVGVAVAATLALPNFNAGNLLFSIPLVLLAGAIALGPRLFTVATIMATAGSLFLAVMTFALVLAISFIAYLFNGAPTFLWFFPFVIFAYIARSIVNRIADRRFKEAVAC